MTQKRTAWCPSDGEMPYGMDSFPPVRAEAALPRSTRKKSTVGCRNLPSDKGYVMSVFFQGLLMGFAYVAPIGMQNLFVINSALSLERRQALLTALIVIFFDVTLALACFWWMGTVMKHHIWLQKAVLLIGSLVVLHIGFGLLRARPAEISGERQALPLLKTISFACVVTWFNPQAVIDGTMMLGAFHATLAGKGAAQFIFGVMTASTLWFLSLTLLISFFRRKFHAGALRGINILSGLIILFYGVKLLLAFLHMM